MMRKISSGAMWLARGAAALAGLCVVAAMVLIGVLVMAAVVAGMFALPSRGHSRTRASGSPASGRRGRSTPSAPALRSYSDSRGS